VEFAVVGAGLLGLSTARALRKRGRDVVLYERSTVGNERSGSKGSSRIFRLGYTDPRYVTMAIEAQAHWRDLEDEAGQPLLDPTGQVSFGAQMDDLLRALTEAGAPALAISAREAQERFPELNVRGDAIYEPQSAVIDAAATLAALRRSVGESLREGEAVRSLADLDAKTVIVCAGPFTKTLVDIPTRATREHVAYFRHRSGTLPAMPIFIHYREPAVYGLPTPSLDAYKLAFHHAGEAVDPESISMEPDPSAVVAIEQAAALRLPNFEPRAVHAEACLYDNTADEHFIVERRDNVVIGAGTSGHAFKFGPLLGERLARLALDDT
jgi:sarcosine oxidase